MLATLSKPHLEMMQGYVDEYMNETGKATATTADLAAWAIRTNRWEPPVDVAMRLCKEEFARAMREEYIKDDNGRPVRAKHVMRITTGGTQQYLWADIRNPNVPRTHIEGAFRQRREQVVGDLRQLDPDNAYWQQLHPGDKPIQLVWDFTDDILEGRYSGEYPPRKPR